MSGFVLVGVGGYILLQASQCQPKNTTSIVIANLLSIAVGTISFWATGYAFSIGTVNNGNFFLSHRRFFLIEADDNEYSEFAREVILLMLVLVLVNAGFVSRMRTWLYPIVSVMVGGFLYPCVRHWTNHKEGWLKDGITVDDNKITYTDNFGAGSIHVFAGSAALIGTVLLSPRKDRNKKKFTTVGGNLTPLILISGFIALVGTMSKNGAFLIPLSLINNVLAAQGSALVAYLLKRTKFFGDLSQTKALVNGALAGLVGVSCMGNAYEPYGGFVIGVISGIAYASWSALLQLCRVDDPTDSIAVHLGAGLWAVLAGPMFQQHVGCFYSGDKMAFQKFGWHLLGGVAIFVWTGLTLFLVLIAFVCCRTISYNKPEVSEVGLDGYVYKEPAYPDRDQYTQDLDHGRIVDDLLHSNSSKGGTYHINGAYDNNPHRAVRQPTEPITLEYRNEQQWRNAKY